MPALCVFDEPNSNLDEAGEGQLIQALLRLRETKRTAIVIAHKPSILNHVGKIMVLQGGQVAFPGPRAEAFVRFSRPVATVMPAVQSVAR